MHLDTQAHVCALSHLHTLKRPRRRCAFFAHPCQSGGDCTYHVRHRQGVCEKTLQRVPDPRLTLNPYDLHDLWQSTCITLAHFLSTWPRPPTHMCVTPSRQRQLWLAVYCLGCQGIWLAGADLDFLKSSRFYYIFCAANKKKSPKLALVCIPTVSPRRQCDLIYHAIKIDPIYPF